MKPITNKETLSNRFCKFNKKTNQVSISKPTREEAIKMRKRTLCLYIASLGLKFRPLDKATDNANVWLNNHTKDEIIKLFF